ncbi:MAG: hypothetical protein NUV69_02405 [Candidatus Curtissbacteria bacterium]|nr:hypothetical protein [Candidatus Curtissbacteria bacterium]
MRKKALIIIALITIAGAVAVLSSLVLSLFVIKPTTDQISQKLREQFQTIIIIPEEIPPPAKSFNETAYYWQMITPEGEIAGVIAKYENGFKKSDNSLKITLEKEENGDPSIFHKLLPHLIVDEKSKKAAEDPEKVQVKPEPQDTYKSVSVFVTPDSKKTARIVWEVDRPQTEELNNLYSRLNKYPEGFVKILFNLQKTTLDLAGV